MIWSIFFWALSFTSSHPCLMCINCQCCFWHYQASRLQQDEWYSHVLTAREWLEVYVHTVHCVAFWLPQLSVNVNELASTWLRFLLYAVVFGDYYRELVSCTRLHLLAIPDGQNFHQKLQALAIIKISIHQKKALSKLYRTITVGHCEFRWYGSYLRF